MPSLNRPTSEARATGEPRLFRPRAALIDFGGFLGVGIRKIAIDWKTLRFDTAGQKSVVVVDLTRDQIKSAPEYKDSREIVAVVTPPQPETGDASPDRGR